MIQSRLPRTLLHVESELKPARSIRKREKWEGETGILGPCMDVLSPWLNVWLNGWLECIPSTQQRGWFNKYLLKEKVRRRVREGDKRERETVRQTDRRTRFTPAWPDPKPQGRTRLPGWGGGEATCTCLCTWGKKRFCSGFYSLVC